MSSFFDLDVLRLNHESTFKGLCGTIVVSKGKFPRFLEVAFMNNTRECCGYHVPAWLFEFLEVNDFSVRAAALICRLYNFIQCNNALELTSVLVDVASGRLPLRYCGRRTQAEIAEKIGYHS